MESSVLANIKNTAVKQGYLLKKPLKTNHKSSSFMYKMKGWKSRWFILTKTCLYYFKGPLDSQPLGSIALDNVRLQPKHMKPKTNKKDRKFKFLLITPCSSHNFSTHTEQEREDWMEAIIGACGAIKLLNNYSTSAASASANNNNSHNNNHHHDTNGDNNNNNNKNNSRSSATKALLKLDTVYTKLQVSVVEAQLDMNVLFPNESSASSNQKTNHQKMIMKTYESFFALNTSFQSFSTMKKYKTDAPIFNEQFVFDCPKFPIDLYVFLNVDELEDVVTVKYNDANSPTTKTAGEDEEESKVLKRKLVKSKSVKALTRVTLVDPPKVNHNNDALKTEGWFKIKMRKNAAAAAESANNNGDGAQGKSVSFVISEDEEQSTQSSLNETIVVGRVFLCLEYVFEDGSGFPISANNVSFNNSSDGSADALASRSSMVQRRYRQELERIAEERAAEIASRIEMNRKSKLTQLKEELEMEEKNFVMQKKLLKKKEAERKQQLEEKLAQEEKERLKQLEKQMSKEEKQRKQELLLATQKREMEQEQARVSAMMDIKQKKEQQMREAEAERRRVESELNAKKTTFEKQMRNEEEELRRYLEDQLLSEQAERLKNIDLKLKADEEYKKKQLKRDIKSLEEELSQKREYMEMQELKRKNLDQEMKKEERRRLRELKKQIKVEELQMLKALQDRVCQQEVQRISEIEQELDQIEKEHSSEKAANSDMNRIMMKRLSTRIQNVPLIIEEDPTQQKQAMNNLLSEIAFAKLKKAEDKSKSDVLTNSSPIASKLHEQLVARRKHLEAQAAEEEMNKTIFDLEDFPLRRQSLQSNVLLDMISKKIAKLERMPKDDDDDELFDSEDDDDWD